MTRLLLARALGVLLIALSLSLAWNAIQEFRYVSGAGAIGVVVLQALGAPIGLLAGVWLWRRDARAVRVTAIALSIATLTGTLAAWTYSVEDRSAAGFGALGAGIVFTIAVVLLARIALRTPSEPVSPAL